MSAPQPTATGTSPAPADRSGRLVAALVLLAVPLGVATAWAPWLMLAAAVALVIACGVLLKPEWTVLLVIAASPFEDYLRLVHPGGIKLLSAALVAGWVARRLLRPDRTSLDHPLTVAAVSFFLVLTVSTAVRPNLPDGPEVTLRYVGFLVVTLVVLDLVRRGLSTRRLAGVLVLACAAAGAAGLVTYVVTAEGRVGGPLEDPNDLAFFLLVAVPFAVALRRTARRRLPWTLVTVVLLVALVGTLSRGALLGLVAMLLFALVRRWVSLPTLAGLVAVVLLGVAAAWVTVPDLVQDSWQEKTYVAGDNADDRIGLWRAAAQMTLEHPLIGTGPGGFSARVADYTENVPETVARDLDVAHNMYLETSSQFGLLGAGALLALMAIGFGAASRRARHDGDPVAAATATALVGAAAAAVFLSEQYYLPIWLLVALGAGCWPIREREPEPESGAVPA